MGLISLLPGWAPNLHPLLVHFPIALVFAALAMDVGAVLSIQLAWPAIGATGLYAAAAVSAVAAYLSGLRAAATVLVPGMANPIVEAHRTWALATAITLTVVAVVRFAVRRRAATRGARLVLLAVGLVGVILLVQTAERGARLVFEQGVGVIPASGPR